MHCFLNTLVLALNYVLCGVLIYFNHILCNKSILLQVCQKWNLIVIIKRPDQCTLSFAKHINCLNFVKQQDIFWDWPKVIG